MTGAIAAIQAQGTPGLSIEADPASVSGFGSSGASANIDTALTTVQVAGGYPSYTYAWAKITPSPYTWVISNPTAATTHFTANAVGPGTTTEADFQVTVTDSAGATITATVNAFANNGQPYDNRVNRVDRSTTGHLL